MTTRKIAGMTCVLFCLTGMAQDPHFSQFHLAGQLYNPAHTGAFDGEVRAITQYRRQWALAGNGYTTQALYADGVVARGGTSADRLAAGLIVVNDKAGMANFRNFTAKTSLSYQGAVSAYDVIGAGLQIGYLQRGISMDGLAWDAQYNGNSYDPSLPTGETPYTDPVFRGIDLSVGVLWRRTIKSGNFYAGYGFRHAGQNQSHLQDGVDRLPMRHSITTGMMRKLRSLWLFGDVLIQRQRGAMEFIPGARMEYRLGNDSKYTDVYTSSAILAGVFYRAGEAVSPMVGFEWKRTAAIAFAYDIPLSRINQITGLGGGPEISLRYTGAKAGRRKLIQ